MLIDITSKAQFQIYYGEEGRVEYGAKSIILCRFSIIISMIDKLKERTF
jgi:hypothetical protein